MCDQKIEFKTAKCAKNMGFDLPTLYYFDFIGDNCCSSSYKENWNKSKETIYSRPSQTELRRWLRENHNLHILLPETFTYSVVTNIGFYVQVVTPDVTSEIPLSTLYSSEYFHGSWEEALEEGLFEALKFIKK